MDVRVFGLTLAKNEGDIIGQMLDAASTFCERIFVYDLGSTDNTWEIVESRAGNGVVVPWRKEDIAYHNGRRARMFNAFHDTVRPGDWWLRLDADEFYDEDPRPILAAAERDRCHVVCSKHIQFYYTDTDYQAWEAGEETIEDRARPIRLRRRYYRVNSSEPMFFRHRRGMEWDERYPSPFRMGLYAKQRVFVRHYQFRDPVQMEQRIRDRLEAKAKGCGTFSHVQDADWRAYMRKAADLHYDTGTGHEWRIDPAELPGHIEPIGRRLLKRLYYGMLASRYRR